MCLDYCELWIETESVPRKKREVCERATREERSKVSQANHQGPLKVMVQQAASTTAVSFLLLTIKSTFIC